VQSFTGGMPFADGSQHIHIREEMLEFSSTVLSTLCLYKWPIKIMLPKPQRFPLAELSLVIEVNRTSNMKVCRLV